MATQPALPGYHIRPRRGWLNDPNGMTYRDGRWHVFYQHNPAAAVHGDIHWGHVSSADLVRWDEHPVAFGPAAGTPDEDGCWSGVFLTGPSGEALVAYSGVAGSDHGASTTVLRRAFDVTLDSWSEPWAVAATPSDDSILAMRDPFVFEAFGRRWALHGAGLDDGTPAVLLFACDDLDAWTYEGRWFVDDGRIGATHRADIWECPQLAFADGRAVLVLSTQFEGHLENVVAVVGDVVEDAARPGYPAFHAAGVERLDGGDRCYAPQFALDPAGSWHLGWVRQDGVEPADHADVDPAELVAGCLTLPRRLAVVDGRIRISRDPALNGLLGSVRELAAGRHELPPAAMVRTRGGTLVSGEGRIDLPPVDAEVWVDGEVVEIYPLAAPPDGPWVPATYRHVGTATWILEVPEGDPARLQAVTE